MCSRACGWTVLPSIMVGGEGEAWLVKKRCFTSRGQVLSQLVGCVGFYLLDQVACSTAKEQVQVPLEAHYMMGKQPYCTVPLPVYVAASRLGSPLSSSLKILPRMVK